MRRTLLGIGVSALATLSASAVARAQFTPAQLLSSEPPLQFQQASTPAFAHDGEYVAFRGTLAGVPGIYRRDLRTGAIALVAGASSQPELNAPDAAAPSISEEGRYVAFTTAHDLDAAVDSGSGCPQVYVRDMDRPLAADRAAEEEGGSVASPYVLASAANGTSAGLVYERPCSASSEGELEIGGSQAAAGVALSADGQKVAFTVLSPSDLTGQCTRPPASSCPTEASQVAVRDLRTETTTLVSATSAGGPTPGGGAFPSTAAEQRTNGGQTQIESPEPTASSASLSADGSTVAWQGTDVPEQVPPSADVSEGMVRYDGPAFEVEPLWRRIGEGPGAHTVRLLAGAGLNFYFGPSHENVDSEDIEGGAVAPAGHLFVAPALSADGRTIAALASAPTPVNEPSYQFLGQAAALLPTELYLVQVGQGAAAAAASVTPLTATPDLAAHNAIFGGVADVAISPDGTRVVFNSRRVSFALAPPALVSPPAPEIAYDYTYAADIPFGTLQRVTSTYDSTPPDGEPGQISFSGDGASLAFSSSAANLFYGDATPGASQVYLTEEVAAEERVAQQSTALAPAISLPGPEWTLSATAAAQRDGSVLIYAELPGAGYLEAHATAQLPLAPKRASSARKERPRGAGASRGRQVGGIVTKTIAHTASSATAPGELRLRLSPTSAYRALVASKDGLYVVLSISFAAPGHATLERKIALTLHSAKAVKKSNGDSTHHGAHRSRTAGGRGRGEAR